MTEERGDPILGYTVLGQEILLYSLYILGQSVLYKEDFHNYCTKGY